MAPAVLLQVSRPVYSSWIYSEVVCHVSALSGQVAAVWLFASVGSTEHRLPSIPILCPKSLCPSRPLCAWGAHRSPIDFMYGRVFAYQEVEIHAKVTGYIRKIYVDIGDHVRAGQLLAELEVPEMTAQVEGAQASGAAQSG